MLPTILGYARDGFQMTLEKTLRTAGRDASETSLREYWSWAWSDLPNLYLMQQAGIIMPKFSMQRLAMVHDPHVQDIAEYSVAAKESIREYLYTRYPGRVTLIRGMHDPLQFFAGQTRTLGWEDIAEAGVEVRFIPGNHMVLFRRPYVASLARELQDCLNAAHQREATQSQKSEMRWT
jgi:thioesterase domain-containing protein